MHDDDLGPDIYYNGFDAGYRQGQKDLWRRFYDALAPLYPDPLTGATSPSDLPKGKTKVLPITEGSAENPTPGAAVAPVRGTPCV